MSKVTMHKCLVTILVGAAILAIITPQASRAATDLQSDAGIEVPGLVPLPEPIEPSQVAGLPACRTTFQLVGFTQASLDGVQGVLNYTLACQREFTNSRMCTIDEIRETISVPTAPGFGFAWIGEPTKSEPANCRGWASSFASDSGTAIDLSARYGAKVTRDCNQPLRIACCATRSEPIPSRRSPMATGALIR